MILPPPFRFRFGRDLSPQPKPVSFTLFTIILLYFDIIYATMFSSAWFAGTVELLRRRVDTLPWFEHDRAWKGGHSEHRRRLRATVAIILVVRTRASKTVTRRPSHEDVAASVALETFSKLAPLRKCTAVSERNRPRKTQQRTCRIPEKKLLPDVL